ncbi:FadR/GntR family transcriptional regulator [Streptomyces yanii]|uniref:FadR/GntR family transcriptional regulator n=1 Tax=Streptomyces yanii TaxID=78510 RepID=A0ABV5R1J0_9ACTN
MKKIERISLVEAISGQLQEGIASGRWPVGGRIPSENELAERLGVSRVSVRAAVQGLVQVGLLTTRQGNGTYVAARDATDVAIRRRLDDARDGDVVEVRHGMDILAAGLAAARRTEQDIAALNDALARRTAAGTTLDEAAFVVADVEFHLCVARASHNELLIELYSTFASALADSIRGDRCLQVFAQGRDAWHSALATAIEEGDADAATGASLALLHNRPAAPRDRTFTDGDDSGEGSAIT